MNNTLSQSSFYIETLGCPKNIVDSRKMRTVLRQAGFQESKTSQNADFILINSCSFIQDAQLETIETVFDFLNHKNKNQKLGLIGCFTERFADEVKKEIPELDFTLGTGKYHQIAELITKKFNIPLIKQSTNLNKSIYEDFNLPYAYFRIAQGCSKKCAFCAIPEIRGKFQEYPLENIKTQYEEEVIQRKIPLREVILVSQDTVSQNLENLQDIIDFFSTQKNIKRIRLQYLFPDKKVFHILEIIKKNPKVVPYLDIPFQHFSPKVLKRMNRPYDISLFEKIISQAKKLIPNIEIRTSLIIGYPGETEEDIQHIISFLEKNEIHKLILFKYSQEKNTQAEKYKDDVSEEEKISRINKINQFFLTHRKQYRENLIDTIDTLLIDKINDLEIIARRQQDSPEADEVVFIDITEENKKNNLTALQVGEEIKIQIKTPMEYDWIGELV